VQKGGVIKVYSQTSNFTLIDTLVTETDLATANEEGLLSLAFHPQYETNGYFFIYYVNASGNLQIARYKRSDADPDEADPGSKAVVLTINHPTQSNHNGGEMHFGKDGMLYLSTGDGGGAGDTPNNAQNPNVLLGKMLRINVTTSGAPPYYTIPADNPNFGSGVSLVYSIGLRNPFRWSFDKLNGDCWIGDVGQSLWEEISHTSNLSGKNFGWRCYEGFAPYNTTQCNLPLANYSPPVHAYPNPSPGSTSIIGGNVYRGYTYQDLKGYYVSCDYYTGRWYKILYNAANNSYAKDTSQVIGTTNISDFGENEAGELFVSKLNNGNVYRVVASGPVRNTFVFTGSGLWNVASNWLNNSIPPATLSANDQIVITPKSGGYCELNVVQNVPEASYISVEPGSTFIVNNNLNITD
jgi:glucose/arabinose dehydrogenase